MTRLSNFAPIYELTRGNLVESTHFGAVAVVEANGRLFGDYGEPQAITYMRSTAKPLQAIPFIEHGGQEKFNLELREIALMCASHAGTDEHVAVLKSIQRKTGLAEGDLMCGTHPLSHRATVEAMLQRSEENSPNRHNCSGKHSGMLAFAVMQGLPKENYIDFQHPIQRQILQTFAEMSALSPEQVGLGIDGCSAPNFAVPLYNAALALARLCDPAAGGVAPPARRRACQTITTAMTTYPEMVGGPESFDTHLMQVMGNRVISKGGAEGYLGIGLLPGAIKPGSPALGIAIKISDGDLKGHNPPISEGRAAVRPAVAIEILRQLGVLNQSELDALANYGPKVALQNWRQINVGEGRPCFQLNWSS
ncbi:MAG TPA: asparaginase [Anaerolineales bacterium]|nr:asparaginase [Anaerolineales bacterium]